MKSRNASFFDTALPFAPELSPFDLGSHESGKCEHLVVIAFIAKEFENQEMPMPPFSRIQRPGDILNENVLTFDRRITTLISRGLFTCLKSQLTLKTPPRVKRVMMPSQVLCGDLWPCRTPKSRPNLTLKREPRSGSERLRLPLPALQATANVRTVPFLPPDLFRSNVRKSASCQRSETLPIENDHRHLTGYLS